MSKPPPCPHLSVLRHSPSSGGKGATYSCHDCGVFWHDSRDKEKMPIYTIYLAPSGRESKIYRNGILLGYCESISVNAAIDHRTTVTITEYAQVQTVDESKQ